MFNGFMFHAVNAAVFVFGFRRFARITHGVFEESKPSNRDTALIKGLRDLDRTGALAAAVERRRAAGRNIKRDNDAVTLPKSLLDCLDPAQVNAILEEVGEFLCRTAPGDSGPHAA